MPARNAPPQHPAFCQSGGKMKAAPSNLAKREIPFVYFALQPSAAEQFLLAANMRAHGATSQ
jgi:hypothetical protein